MTDTNTGDPDGNQYDYIDLPPGIHYPGTLVEKEKKKEKKNPKEIGNAIVLCILVTELCERLTYYSITANLILFCQTKLQFSTPDSSNIAAVFAGTCFVVPVIGGWIADSVSGKFNAIYGSGLIYMLGCFLLPASSVDYVNWFGHDADGRAYDLNVTARRAFFFSGLMFVAIGTGGIKANVGPFGAQQVEHRGKKAVESFFNWFYWFINVGALIATSAVAYVQQNLGFDYGFMIPFITMIFSLGFLVLGKNRFGHRPPEGSVLTAMVKVIREGKRLKKLNPGALGSFLDYAEKANGGTHTKSFVEGLRSCFRMLPVFTCIIFYWVVYIQMPSTFYAQSERLNILVGGTALPIAILQNFDVLIILLLIPLLDRIVYPLLTKRGKMPTTLQRIGIGMILASAAMFTSGGVEFYRKQVMLDGHFVINELNKKSFNASSVTMFIQIPQFCFIGASEVFASISGLEFAFSQAPQSMKGVVMGLFLLTSGLGSYLASALVKIINVTTAPDEWFPDEINKGKLDLVFFLLGGMMIIVFIVFIFVAKYYKYYDPIEEEDAVVPKDKEKFNDAYVAEVDPGDIKPGLYPSYELRKFTGETEKGLKY